jgi:hypothetical protein
MRTISLALVLACAAASAGAQQSSTVYYAAPFSISSGRDTGVPVKGGQVSDSVLEVSAPAFSYWAPGPKSEVSFTYQPQFRLYATHRDLNSWNHNAGARFSYRATPRLTFEGGDTFYSTADFSLLQQTLFLLPRVRYNQNALYLQGGYDLTARTRVSLRLDNTYATLDDPVLAPAFDYIGGGLSAGLTRQFSPRQRVSVSGSFVRTFRLNSHDASGLPLGPPPKTAKSAGMTYDLALSRTLSLLFSGGYVRTNANSYTVSGALAKQVGKLNISGGYSRYLSFFGGLLAPVIPAPQEVRLASGIRDSSLSETAGLHVRGDLTRRVGVVLGVSGSRSLTGPGTKDLKSLVSQVRVDYKLNDHLVLFTSAEMYRQNSNSLVVAGIDRRRYFGGLEVVLFPTAEMVKRRRSAPVDVGVPAAEAASGTERTKVEDK